MNRAPVRAHPHRHREKRDEERAMRIVKACFPFLLILAVAGTAAAQQAPQAKVASLMTKALAEYPGKELTMITVDYPPGAVDPVHRHDAYALVYVLEGSIVMGVRGGRTVTLTPGQTFYEGPNDVHTVGRNASRTKPARFLVVLLKNRDEPILMPAK
jgi:quercetin dioxygenase-like cupin family protein